MTDSRVSHVAPGDSPVDVDDTLDQILTKGIHRAARWPGLNEARLASSLSGVLVASGTVLPMPPQILTDEARERIVRAFKKQRDGLADADRES